ncbi:MAG: cobalamin biosynthesis protein CobW [Proteobacteria bacterium]|nr:cobalamin biosynthesis protein CobW [Pseudomonadota bacterium]
MSFTEATPSAGGARIPATVITGFLGAGKTSLIRHALETANGRRLALIINEFGELGIDGSLLEGCGIESCAEGGIIELANGCICCTVADEFLPTMETLIALPRPPDGILIETSGLALPKPLLKAFTWPEIRSRVTVDGVVAVIDAAAVHEGRFADDPAEVQARRLADPALDHDNPLEEVFGDQIDCADLVVLNKTDLIDAAALRELEAGLRRRLKPSVKLLRASFGAVPARLILDLAASAEDDIDNRRSHHDGAPEDHDHDDFESFSVALGKISDLDGLMTRLKALAKDHDILRLKGFVEISGRDMRHVIQGVGARLQGYYDRPWRVGEARKSVLVIIGRKGIDRARIETALAG